MKPHSPFLIMRFIFFALMVFMSLLTMIFAGWNISASKSLGNSAPGSSVFLISNGCMICVFVAAGLAELFSSSARTANVAFECLWTAIFSLLELVAGITAAVNGPPNMCYSGAPWKLCASSIAIIPVSWVSLFVVLVYFFVLMGVTIAHMHTTPTIWWNTMYSVQWFALHDTNGLPVSSTHQMAPIQPSQSKAPSVKSRDSQFLVMRYLRERFSTKIDDDMPVSEPILFPVGSSGLYNVPRQNSGIRPTWAQPTQPTQRGVDKAFTTTGNIPIIITTDTSIERDIDSDAEETVGDHEEEHEYETASAPAPPLVPATHANATRLQNLRAQAKSNTVNEWAIPITLATPPQRGDGPTIPPKTYNGTAQYNTRPLLPAQRKIAFGSTFKAHAHDEDAPIPLPKRSEWIPASPYGHR